MFVKSVGINMKILQKRKSMNKQLAILLLASLSLMAIEYSAVVTKVVDGDTLHVTIGKTDEKIRILYVDTPEKYGGSKLEKDAIRAGISPEKEQELGKLASGYASRFFQKGDAVIVSSSKKDQYGRMLGTVNKNGVDYSKQIIADGYSCIYKKSPYPREFENILESAKARERGLWGIDFETMKRLCK